LQQQNEKLQQALAEAAEAAKAAEEATEAAELAQQKLRDASSQENEEWTAKIQELQSKINDLQQATLDAVDKDSANQELMKIISSLVTCAPYKTTLDIVESGTSDHDKEYPRLVIRCADDKAKEGDKATKSIKLITFPTQEVADLFRECFRLFIEYCNQEISKTLPSAEAWVSESTSEPVVQQGEGIEQFLGNGAANSAGNVAI
jgi:uncharacterized protein YfkK (UPF0435 family)